MIKRMRLFSDYMSTFANGIVVRCSSIEVLIITTASSFCPNIIILYGNHFQGGTKESPRSATGCQSGFHIIHLEDASKIPNNRLLFRFNVSPNALKYYRVTLHCVNGTPVMYITHSALQLPF